MIMKLCLPRTINVRYAYIYPVLAMKLRALLNQSVIADGITVRRTASGNVFDSWHHLQFTVIGRKFREEVRDDCEQIFSHSGNRLHATTQIAGDARRTNPVCSFAADCFNIGLEFRMHRDSFHETQLRAAPSGQATS